MCVFFFNISEVTVCEQQDENVFKAEIKAARNIRHTEAHTKSKAWNIQIYMSRCVKKKISTTLTQA